MTIKEIRKMIAGMRSYGIMPIQTTGEICDMLDSFAAEIEKLQPIGTPRTKEKTAGEIAAEKYIDRRGPTDIRITNPNPAYGEFCLHLDGATLIVFRQYIAAIIDAERADAIRSVTCICPSVACPIRGLPQGW